ncbi:hypothetical protein [uncultured Aeromicrobium sp.]|uniref:GGDEF domain-containing protein n=1 Tax=uncultured Aeromicrobium sp. TaxID=337820 RepID=UPI0025DA3509|nr:hypothetical protein [uncultured Aeromicrobium sp.]
MDDFPSAQSSALSRTVRRWRDISAGAGPYPDVSAAAEDVVELLSQLAPRADLWFVTGNRGDMSQARQSLLAWSGPWAAAGQWPQDALLRVLISGSGRIEVPATVSDERPLSGRQHLSYVASPILDETGVVRGMVCGVAQTVDDPDELQRWRPAVSTAARMLATLMGSPVVAAVGEWDRETGLRNADGFDEILRAESNRCRLFGSKAALVVVDVRGSAGLVNREGLSPWKAIAALVSDVCHDCDVPARIGATRFAVLTVETDLRGATALAVRLRRRLREAGITASIGVAARRVGEDLGETMRRAGERPSLHTHRLRRTTHHVSRRDSGRRPGGAS